MDTPKTLTAIDQLALKAIVDHLEPHDCQWNLYGEAAQSVVDAVDVPIQLQAMRAWADELERLYGDREVTISPTRIRARAAALEAEHAQKKEEKETNG